MAPLLAGDQGPVYGSGMKIGSRIAEARQSRGLTQKQVADALWISVQAVSQWETGKSGPRGARLNTLAALLEVNPRWLAGDEGAERNAQKSGQKAEKNPVPVIMLQHAAGYFSHAAEGRQKYVYEFVTSTYDPVDDQFAIKLPLEGDAPEESMKGEIIIFESGVDAIENDLVLRMRVTSPVGGARHLRHQHSKSLTVDVYLDFYKNAKTSPKEIQLELEFELASAVKEVDNFVLGVAIERRRFRSPQDASEVGASNGGRVAPLWP